MRKLTRKGRLGPKRKGHRRFQARFHKNVDASFDQGYNQGYDQGYDKGYQGAWLKMAQSQAGEPSENYNSGYDKGYDEGFNNGHHAGGDGIVDQLLPEYEILPEVTVEEILAAGIEQLRPRIRRLLTARELADRLIAALESKTPLSVVRLGDGELLTLAQETVMPIEQVRSEGTFLEYAGVHVPDLAARDTLAQSIRQADIIGIPKLRVRNYQPLAFSVFRAHQIDYHSLTLTDSLVNYYLYKEGALPRIMAGRRILLVGNMAPALGELLRNSGIQVAGVVYPVQGFKDIPRVMGEIRGHEFDLAFVSSGISAVVLSQWIATELGKVAIDFGHLADSIVKGDAPFP